MNLNRVAMNLNELINTITPEIYDRLKRACELGKWDNGQLVTGEQREHILQAIIAYDEKHKSPEDRIGYVEPKKPADCSESNGDIVDIIKIRDL